MSKMLDIQCNVEFPNDALYLVHKKSDHKLHLDKAVPLETPPDPSHPLDPTPDGPSQEFLEAVARIEAKDTETPSKEQSKASQHPSELPPSIPLVLEYVWKGEHEKCRRQPSTLKLEVGGKFFSVAYCESCKEQLESREVENLGN